MQGLSGFLDLAAGKLQWIDQRTRMLAQNVANADTPGYKPRDVAPFASTLGRQVLALDRSDDADLDADPVAMSASSMADPGEAAPDGNAVSVEHQMKMLADEQQDQQMVSSLYRKYESLNSIALGQNG